MLKLIDNFLNKITMYKLILYYLIALLLIAMSFGGLGLLPYNPIAILFSTLFITTLCLIVNIIFAWAFDAPTNAESVYITALILALIITPIASPHDSAFLMLALWAAVWAMASKYILAINKKHVFNPAALAVALTALTINQSASWWVGTTWLALPVLIGGLLLTRKIQRADLVTGFLTMALIVGLGSHVTSWGNLWPNFWRALTLTPLLFFAFVMLTEPLTTPPQRWLRILYGALVGLLFAPAVHLWSIYSTPELALIAGNIFAYLVSPKQKLLLKLSNRITLATDTYDFIFTPDQPLKFKPGQYLEWTLDRSGVDSRGNRRYFTIASSPTEKQIAIGVKFYPEPSSFKQHLLAMKRDEVLVASQLAGEFVLPKNKKQKLVFIAGGIGITPFRSMIKYLIDTGEARDIVLFYSTRTPADVVYREVFDQAARQLGIKTVYTGLVTDRMVTTEVPDYHERQFYLSGPRAMVVGFSQTLKNLGIRKSHIKTDFFPGFA